MPFRNRLDLNQLSNKLRAYDPMDIPDPKAVYLPSKVFDQIVGQTEMHDQWATGNEIYIETTEPDEQLIELLQYMRCTLYELVGKYLQQIPLVENVDGGQKLYCADEIISEKSVERRRYCQERSDPVD